jgi:hypothetical protein
MIAARKGWTRWVSSAGTVTLIEICSGSVGLSAAAMDQCGVIGISCGSIKRDNLIPDREAFSHLGSPSGWAESMPTRSKMCGDAAKSRQELLGMAHRLEAP